MSTDIKSSEHNTETLTQLENHAEFVRRHIGPDESQIQHMLNELGEDSLDALVAETIPSSIYNGYY